MTAQPTNTRGFMGRVGILRDTLAAFAAMPLDKRLAYAKAVDAAAGIKVCSKCKAEKVYSADPARSEYRKNAVAHGGYHGQCKACADLVPSRANRYAKTGKPAVITIEAPKVKRGGGRPKKAQTRPATFDAPALINKLQRLQHEVSMLDERTESNPAPSPAVATVSAMVAPIETQPAPVAPAPDDLIWVGDDAYNRRKIVQMRRYDIDGTPALSVVLDAIEHDPKSGVSKSISVDFFGAEVDEVLSQLRGDWGNLANRLRLMRAETDSAYAAAERWEKAYRLTLAERDAARVERDKAEVKASDLFDEVQRYKRAVSRLAAAGITINFD